MVATLCSFLLASWALPLVSGEARAALPDPVFLAPPPNLAALEVEDAAAAGPRPYRYGAPLAVDLGPDRLGAWSEEAGRLRWRLRVESPGALSLGFVLEEVVLPAGARLTVDGVPLVSNPRPYAAGDVLADGSLHTVPVLGDTATLELSLPSAGAEDPGFRVTRIIHGYRGLLDVGAAPTSEDGAASFCYVDVNCPAGDPFPRIRRATVMLLMGAGSSCSATLLNNTAEDGTPYLLTAKHCGNQRQSVFLFNYERPGCGSSMPYAGSGLQTEWVAVTGGATPLVTASSDQRLVRMNTTPPPEATPFYAGWTRSKSPKGPAACFSHPQSGPKRIAIDDQDPKDHNGLGWKVNWETGQVGGGSSGSGLLTRDQRVIGTLSSTSNFCGQTAIYTYFYRFYDERNLARWLDPLGQGVRSLDGFDPYAATARVYNGQGINRMLYTGTAPALGQTWTGRVDTSGHASTAMTLLCGYSAPASGHLFLTGELLVDLRSRRLFASTSVPIGDVSTHTIPIPNDPTISGTVAWSQAFLIPKRVRTGYWGVQATNGVVLTLN